MRRWTLTLILGLTAIVAAVLAPRLMREPEPACAAATPPVVSSVPDVSSVPQIPELPPPRVLILESHQTEAPEVPVIPELSEPPGVEPPEIHWDDCPACGMG